MRCRTLARELRRRGSEIAFVCRRQPGDLIGVLEAEFRVLTLAEVSVGQQGTGLTGRELYASWLGCTEEQDAADCLVALHEAQIHSPDWLVLDHYGLGRAWQRRMQVGLAEQAGAGTRLLVVDDLADRPHEATLLIDANRLGNTTTDPYRHLVPEATITLLGPAYALLDPLYTKLQPLLPVRTQLQRVLVFFGGVDRANHTAMALQALSHPKLQHLTLDVVLGMGSPHFDELQAHAEQRPQTSLHIGLSSLAGLMARADLALGAAGITSWERACLGLPSLVVPVAENQIQGARALHTSGVARCLLDVSAAALVPALQTSLIELLEEPDVLQQMSEACLQLGDGRGLARVCAALLGPAPGVRLRPAQSTDLWLYHWWANDVEVRRQSFNSEPIPLDEHRRWFQARLRSPWTLLRVLEDTDGLPLGQIRFERTAESSGPAVVGFSLDHLARGRGLAGQLLQLGLAELGRCWGVGTEAYGEVRAGNAASCRAFVRAGFQEGAPPRPGVRCFARTAPAPS